jgi:hypothetical protein
MFQVQFAYTSQPLPGQPPIHREDGFMIINGDTLQIMANGGQDQWTLVLAHYGWTDPNGTESTIAEGILLQNRVGQAICRKDLGFKSFSQDEFQAKVEVINGLLTPFLPAGVWDAVRKILQTTFIHQFTLPFEPDETVGPVAG